MFNPQRLNRYSYVTNDPINKTDALGLDGDTFDEEVMSYEEWMCFFYLDCGLKDSMDVNAGPQVIDVTDRLPGVIGGGIDTRDPNGDYPTTTTPNNEETEITELIDMVAELRKAYDALSQACKDKLGEWFKSRVKDRGNEVTFLDANKRDRIPGTPDNLPYADNYASGYWYNRTKD